MTAYPQDQLAWALSLVHSRSFLQGGEHVLVPGVDFCNHSSAPTGTVRCVHSPESCQVSWMELGGHRGLTSSLSHTEKVVKGRARSTAGRPRLS